MDFEKKVLIFGATGNVGGAATRELLKRGWQVRAFTRDAKSEKAQALAGLGAELMQGDMDDRSSVEAAFAGIERVFSVQNWITAGVDGEVRQGKLVADVAHAVGVQHLVYGSAGTGDTNTGIAHFDNKLEVEAYMRSLGLPFTVVRPGPFMELLTDKQFFPALAAWGTQTRVMGWQTPIPWVAIHDIGLTIANIFDDSATWIGQDVHLIGDVKNLQECQTVFQTVQGKKPFRLALPVGLFQKMAGEEFVHMWRWMNGLAAERGERGLREYVQEARRACPQMLDMESWLKMRQNGVA